MIDPKLSQAVILLRNSAGLGKPMPPELNDDSFLKNFEKKNPVVLTFHGVSRIGQPPAARHSSGEFIR